MDQRTPVFPKYLMEGINYELPAVPWENESSIYGEKQSHGIYSLGQHFDFFDALKYAQLSFPFKNIKSLSSQQLAEFIKNLHKIATKTLLYVSRSETIGGQFSTVQPLVVKESGVSGLDYEQDDGNGKFFSKNNFEILSKLYGLKNAQQYEIFCNLLFEKQVLFLQIKNLHGKLYESNKISISDVIAEYKLSEHPGYIYFLKTVSICNTPEKIPSIFENFCQTLCNMIKNGENPFRISAYCLELTLIHAFVNGNGRIARILMNCILMAYHKSPLNLELCKKEYYAAIEASANDKNAIEKFIRSQSEKSPVQQVYEDVFGERSFQLIASDHLLFVKYNGKYECVKFENYEQYTFFVRQRSSIQRGSAIPLPSPMMQQMKEMVQKNLEKENSILGSKVIEKIIDSKFCIEKADFYQKNKPYMAICYYLQASCFLLHEEKFGLAAKCQFNAAKLYFSLNHFDGAYDFSREAEENYSKAGTDLTEIKSFIQTLNFVKEHRKKLFLSQRIVMDKKIPDTTLIGLLKKNTELTFFALRDEDYKVDAVVETSNSMTEEAAKNLQSQLGRGEFFTIENKKYFVLEAVNLPEKNPIGNEIQYKILNNQAIAMNTGATLISQMEKTPNSAEDIPFLEEANRRVVEDFYSSPLSPPTTTASTSMRASSSTTNVTSPAPTPY